MIHSDRTLTSRFVTSKGVIERKGPRTADSRRLEPAPKPGRLAKKRGPGQLLQLCFAPFAPAPGVRPRPLPRARAREEVLDHRYTFSIEPDGRGGPAAVGPAHGQHRRAARLWRRSAPRASAAACATASPHSSSGLGITMLLQSSTATALMAASFASRGLVSTASALAIMLGADVGTSLVAQLVSFKVDWLSPVLILIGRHRLSRRAVRPRSAIWAAPPSGLGLILLALHLMSQAAAPMRDSPAGGRGVQRALRPAGRRHPDRRTADRYFHIQPGGDPAGHLLCRQWHRRRRRRLRPRPRAPIWAVPSRRCWRPPAPIRKAGACRWAMPFSALVGVAVALPLLPADRALCQRHRGRALAPGRRFPHRLQPGSRHRLHRADRARWPAFARDCCPTGREAADDGKPRYLDRAAMESPAVAIANGGARDPAHGRSRRPDAGATAGRRAGSRRRSSKCPGCRSLPHRRGSRYRSREASAWAWEAGQGQGSCAAANAAAESRGRISANRPKNHRGVSLTAGSLPAGVRTFECRLPRPRGRRECSSRDKKFPMRSIVTSGGGYRASASASCA